MQSIQPHSENSAPTDYDRFRDACVNLYFLDQQTAAAKDVETRLWAAHGRVNTKFRSYLATLKARDAKKKFVERRKAEEMYKSFIKSSTTFYRTFIRRLAAHFKDVPEIFKIAQGFGMDPATLDSPIDVDLDQKHALLRSCHATLIHLGDLSRYRETEIPKNADQRNWGPAVGYYDLAGALMPHDGQSYNQLAVISLANNDHLRAVYHLYRALNAENPPEPARGNLELELKKIRNKAARDEALLPLDSTSTDPELETLFLTYHAKCYGDNAFDDDHAQATTIVSSFAQALKDKPYDSAARKMCHINISASHYAEQCAREVIETNLELFDHRFKTYEVLQDLNIVTFTMLLRLLAEEMEGENEKDEAITPMSRKVLPLLQLYSSWFLTKAEFLLQTRERDDKKHPSLPTLWHGYAKTLELLVTAYPRLPDSMQIVTDCNRMKGVPPDVELPRSFGAIGDRPKSGQMSSPGVRRV